MSIGPLGPVSFQGIASGLNVSAIVQKLMAVNELPLQQLTQEQGTITQEETAWSGVSSGLQSLVNALSALDQSLFQTMSATSSNPSVLTASATSGAVAASYNVSVSALAEPEIDASAGFSSATTALGFSGSFTINGKSVTVSTTDTLSSIAQDINNAGAGVTATVVNTGASTNPYEIWITSQATGTANAIAYQDTSGTPLVSLGILTSSGTVANQIQAPANAAFTVNGASFSSGSNTVTGALPDITLSLLTTGSATVSVSPDTASMASAIQSFVSAYNGLVATFQQDLAPTGPLAGNASLQTVWNTLATSLFATVPTGTSIQSLADIGITFVPATIGGSQNGTLQVNTTTLQNALATNLQGVEALFTGATGLVSILNGIAGPMSQPGGIIAQMQNDLQQQSSALTAEEQQLQQQLNQEQNLLTEEFNAIEPEISRLQAQGALLTFFGGSTSQSSPTSALASSQGSGSKTGG